MKQDTLVGSEPLLELRVATRLCMTLAEEPRRAPTTAEFAVNGVVGAEPLVTTAAGDIMETVD